jgi:hypothetical protein
VAVVNLSGSLNVKKSRIRSAQFASGLPNTATTAFTDGLGQVKVGLHCSTNCAIRKLIPPKNECTLASQLMEDVMRLLAHHKA